MLKTRILSALGGEKLYVDDVFQAYTRTGTGADTTITTDIDMTKGYMLWSKGRSDATDHAIYDSARGVTLDLASNTTAAQTTQTTGLKSVSATGHTVGSLAKMNTSAATYVDFVFRKAPKFFDAVTYVGNNGAARTISHSLGTAPGMIIIKNITGAGGWAVYHRSLANTEYLLLDSTAAKVTGSSFWNSTTADASTFSLASGLQVNNNGDTYVAYLFAHDPSADGIIQCGSYVGGTAGTDVTLGFEPQFLLIKSATGGTGDWLIFDSMRGLTVVDASGDNALSANTSAAELNYNYLGSTAAGFKINSTVGDINGSDKTYIYLAIRRPNKPPTSGTEVYNSTLRPDWTLNATYDLGLNGFDLVGGFGPRGSGGYSYAFLDRLRGQTQDLKTASTAGEVAVGMKFVNQSSISPTDGTWGPTKGSAILHAFRRAPCFLDEVCDTGTGAAHAISHNLGTVPELMIRKGRSGATQWEVYSAALANTEKLVLNSTAAKATDTTAWNSTSPAANAFTVGTGANVNTSGATYVTYLFASLPGISKVFSFTGNGTNQNIECGFTTGARFVLLKRTDSAGDWLVADTARGLVADNDPSLSLNSTAAEVTTLDWIDPYSGGFNIVQEAGNNANVNGATYIGLAIA